MREGAIETERLTRVFREPRRLFHRARGEETVALADVTLRVEPGECLALVGPNGAGKSTILRILATLIAPTSGVARVSGFDVVRQPREVRRSVGIMTGDDRSFFWPLTATENLIFFGELQGLDRKLASERAAEMLDRVGLAHASERRVAGFSAGMRQLLNIARGFLHDPPIILLDEPTASLDREHRSRLIEAIQDVARDGSRTVLTATHDAGLVVAIADRTLRLDSGRVVSEQSRHQAVSYRLRVGGIEYDRLHSFGVASLDGDGSALLEVEDLGDGYSLSSTIAGIVADGGEILDVEMLNPARVRP